MEEHAICLWREWSHMTLTEWASSSELELLTLSWCKLSTIKDLLSRICHPYLIWMWLGLWLQALMGQAINLEFKPRWSLGWRWSKQMELSMSWPRRAHRTSAIISLTLEPLESLLRWLSALSQNSSFTKKFMRTSLSMLSSRILMTSWRTQASIT